MASDERASCGAGAGRHSEEGARKGDRRLPAQIKLVYESADRRFCLFEDADGHLTSVRSSKLA